MTRDALPAEGALELIYVLVQRLCFYLKIKATNHGSGGNDDASVYAWIKVVLT